MMNFNELKTRLDNSTKADFGTAFNQSIELFKKSWVQGLIFTLLTFAVVFVVELVVVSSIAVIAAFFGIEDSGGGPQETSVLSIILIIGSIVLLLFLIMTLINGVLGGLYIVYKKIDHNEPYSSSDFFTLLKGPYFLKTFLVSLVQLGLILLFYLMCFFPIIYAAVPISYIIIIYTFNPHLTVGEIVKLSFGIGNKNWVETFLLRLVGGFVAMMGIILCGVGILATGAFVLIPQYFVYKHVIGFDSNDAIDEIGSANE